MPISTAAPQLLTSQDKYLRRFAEEISQEAFIDAERRTKTNCADAIMEIYRHELILLVEDNGTGFDVQSNINDQESDKHAGIRGMIERALPDGQVFRIARKAKR